MLQPLYTYRQGKVIGPCHLPNRCIRCGKLLNPATTVMLELDLRTDEYHDFGNVPADMSQGGFEFGADCAAILRKRALEAAK